MNVGPTAIQQIEFAGQLSGRIADRVEFLLPSIILEKIEETRLTFSQ